MSNRRYPPLMVAALRTVSPQPTPAHIPVVRAPAAAPNVSIILLMLIILSIDDSRFEPRTNASTSRGTWLRFPPLRRHLTSLFVALVLLLRSEGVLRAQTPPDGQVWLDFILSWPKTLRLTYALDINPEVLVVIPPGASGWASLPVTPSVDYAVKRWLDAIGEFVYSPTKQTNHVNTREVTGRAGVRFHLLSRDIPIRIGDRELLPRRRVVLSDFARIEQRNLFYSDDTSTSHTWRFRNRLEFQVPFNHENMTVDKTWYLAADWEWFDPLPHDAGERFANKQRIRVGVGYRQNFSWRYEALYIWSRSLDTTTNSFTTADNIIYFGVKRVF